MDRFVYIENNHYCSSRNILIMYCLHSHKLMAAETALQLKNLYVIVKTVSEPQH